MTDWMQKKKKKTLTGTDTNSPAGETGRSAREVFLRECVQVHRLHVATELVIQYLQHHQFNMQSGMYDATQYKVFINSFIWFTD